MRLRLALAAFLLSIPATGLAAQDSLPPPRRAPRDTIRIDSVRADTLRPDSVAVDTTRPLPTPPRRARADSAAGRPPRAPRRATGARGRPRPMARDTARLAGRGRRGAGPRVCAGGDVTLGTNLDTTWVFTASQRAGRRVAAFPDPDSLLAPLRPLVRDADVLMLNVEGAIGEGPPPRRKCAPNSNTCFAFRYDPAAAEAFRRLAGDAAFVGNVANNHARDAGEGGWYVTMRHLRNAGGWVTGADTLATPVATAEGDTIAFLGFSPWTGPDPRNLAAVRRHVARAAARWKHVVVSVHIGAEGRGAQHTANATEMFLGEDRGNPVAFAHAAVEAGATLVFGSGPHVVRAAEWYRGGLIFYSLGNLVTYGPFTLSEPLNRGGIACADLDPDGGVMAAEFRSTRQAIGAGVRPDPSGTAAALIDQLGASDMPATAARVAPDGTLLRPSGSTASGGQTTGGSDRPIIPRRRP